MSTSSAQVWDGESRNQIGEFSSREEALCALRDWGVSVEEIRNNLMITVHDGEDYVTDAGLSGEDLVTAVYAPPDGS